MNVRQTIIDKAAAGTKMLAMLIDPDKANASYLEKAVESAENLKVDFFLIGGSLLTDGDLDATIKQVKTLSRIPTVIFPGSTNQVSTEADALLFLSLLSSRNPEMLIGKQVIAAPILRKTNLEVISTAYLLIESGTQTTASYMSNSTPIPSNKEEIAASTALAGDYMGMDLIYMDGGSGAKNPVPAKMIAKVKEYTQKPLIIGGGIDSIEKMDAAYQAGADMIVIGNAFEKNPDFAEEILEARAFSNSL